MSRLTSHAPGVGRVAGPLHDLLVVDFSRVLAGPFATMMLADLGARVIKVERPDGGDDSRTYGPFVEGRSLYFARVNRGKESIALSLKDPADLELARELVRRADVLVENFRPGVMTRLGLGPQEALELNPRLVYCSLSGFGHTGPWSRRPAYDAVVQGMSGIMAITGPSDGPPVKPGSPVADLSAGLYAFGGICAALRAEVGTHLDVAMYDSTVSLLEGAALAWLATGQEPGRIGNAHFAIAPFDTFRCADRDITVCAANDLLFGALAAALGLPGLLVDARFTTNALRHEHRDALKALLESVLRTAGADHWLGVLETAGVPSGPINDVAEAVGSEQSRARNMVIDAGGLPVPGQPLKLSAWPDPPTRAAAPGLDQHGAAIRAQLSSDSGTST
ncbi:MAG TPA: CoA transferase [Mycobacteriales bacterium]|nr:CoA transferase [Mycobacteriales bacterium]